MTANKKRAGHLFPWYVLFLCLVGFFIFTSAALGLHGRDGAEFSRVVIKQLIILGASLLLALATAHWPYARWRRAAPVLLGTSLVLTALVFAPHIGFSAGGARRWLDLGFISIQPSEFLKLTFVIYLASWLCERKDKLHTWSYGLAPFLLLVGVVSGLLLAQPDLGTLLISFAAGLAMWIVAGGKWNHLALILLLTATMVMTMAYFKPYVRERLTTFLNPNQDVRGASYQINQSLVAIGSGGWFGRGFGQSVQKFDLLPEPIGDSLFAVASEEFGFVGSVSVVIFFLVFALWGLKIAAKTDDQFGRLLAVGIVILTTAGAMVNIGSMVGVLPVVGIPLSLFSHGGSALLSSLVGLGILVNISRGHKS
ncbi:MAG: FtsW/RodA/SpoVE family cell cycle protein [Patescibacteria group bacterium]